MVRKWPTASLKQQAYILRKEEGLSDEQIYQRFVQEGKMVLPHIPEDAQTTIDKINADVLHKHKPITHSASNDEAEPIVAITEDVWEKYLIRLIKECEPSSSIATQIKEFLDKKQAITQKEIIKPKPALEDSSVLSD
jgi:hypothetical protein